MGLNFDAELRGAEAVLGLLRDAGAIISDLTSDELTFVGEDVVLEMQDYPPESEANQPPPPYYQRHVGYYGRTGNLTKPSQQLSERWETSIQSSAEEAVLTIRNVATYSGWVHGALLQVSFHANRGWRKLATVAQSMVEGRGGTGTVSISIRDRGNRILQRFKHRFGEL